MPDPATLLDRASTLRNAFAALPDGAIVYYEDAGFHHQTVRAAARTGFGGLPTFHGLNEDELQGYIGRSIDLLDPEEVAAALEDVKKHLLADTIVVHTKYWALAKGASAAAAAAALQGGIDFASTRYLFGDEFTPEGLTAVQNLPVQLER